MKEAQKSLENIREDLRALSAAKKDYELQFSTASLTEATAWVSHCPTTKRSSYCSTPTTTPHSSSSISPTSLQRNSKNTAYTPLTMSSKTTAKLSHTTSGKCGLSSRPSTAVGKPKVTLRYHRDQIKNGGKTKGPQIIKRKTQSQQNHHQVHLHVRYQGSAD
jgi:hypothetical protein